MKEKKRIFVTEIGRIDPRLARVRILPFSVF
jgi:hypothetical protein